jgi:thiol:disulfide interchange protein DsbC
MRLLRQLLTSVSIVSVLLASFASQADEASTVKEKLEALGVNVAQIQPSDIDGLFEVHTNQGVLFSTKDGQYFIAGTLYHLSEDGKISNVLAERQAPLNAAAIAKLRDDVIEYKADDEKYAVTIFTDITCGYCVKLHSQIDDYNALGITVRYLAFPRQGLNNQVAQQMADIWCAADPKQALHDAKISRKLPSSNGQKCVSKVAEQYHLGQTLGVSGTPAIFLPDGSMVGGYLPPEALLERLENL